MFPSMEKHLTNTIAQSKKKRCTSISAFSEGELANIEVNNELLDLEHRLRKVSEETLSQSASFVFTLKNQIGGLAAALKLFQDNRINVVHIESRKSRYRNSEYEIYVDIEADNSRLTDIVSLLESQVSSIAFGNVPCSPLDKNGKEITKVPWFPRKISDLDQSSNRVLMYGTELDADHPGFKDKVYRQRRKSFTDIAMNFKHGQCIPYVEYTETEIQTWGTVFRELNKLYPKYACREHLVNLPLLQQHCGYREDNIPQLQDVSNFLKERTGFQLRPVAGYLSPRDFLAGLAFRVFHCTQYIRHQSDPFYTPEPDCCHELLGHMGLLADPNFAQFSQEIGLVSLGATDEDVQKLATCYFFTVEFGLCKQEGDMKVYGAGLLSSISEFKHAVSEKAEIKHFDPNVTCNEKCLITTFQKAYFFTDSFEQAKEKMRSFASTIKRPFAVRYNPYTQSVDVLDSARQIATVVSELKGDLCIISDAVKKLGVTDDMPQI